MSLPPHPTTAPPETWVGRYRLLARIGEGGMGVVHLAQAPDGRRVALKVLRPHVVGDDEARERLAREVTSLQRVRSPRIAEVLDADPWGETPFVATRYVPGLSLHEHVRQHGVLAGEDLRHFAAGLAEAMLAVHSVGVLHRDIKPSNVLLEGRNPVLIDFGLARLAEDPRLTVTGWLLGTPGYLAPEILYGEDATTASDVHSWAATVVFAATGRPPFGRGPAMAIMDRVRRGEHDLSGVPAGLLPLVEACLAPEAADRPDTSTIIADLRAPRLRTSAGADPGPTVPAMPTMPIPLADAGADDDPTIAGPLTTPYTVHAPAAPYDQHQPAAYAAPADYADDADDSTDPDDGQWTEPWAAPPPERPSVRARLHRGLLLLGLLALVTAGFARAPYLTLVLVTAGVLVVRTLSCAGDATSDRRLRRGRRWYDGLLATLGLPWHLLVATGGTLLLVLWAVAVTIATGVGVLVLGLGLLPGLLATGGALALSLWWGPGSRRVRRPVRGTVNRVAGRAWSGWLGVVLLVAAVALPALGLLDGQVAWDPQPGPPWRDGTLLGEVVRFVEQTGIRDLGSATRTALADSVL